MVQVASNTKQAMRGNWTQEIQTPLGTTSKESEIFPTTSPSSMISVAPSHLHHQCYTPSLPSRHTHTYCSIPITQAQTPPSKNRRFGPYSPHFKGAKKKFTPLPYPINCMLTNLVNEEHLHLLPPRQTPSPLPKTYNVKKYCTYH